MAPLPGRGPPLTPSKARYAGQGFLISTPALSLTLHFPTKPILRIFLFHGFSTRPWYPPGPLQHNQTPVSSLSYLGFWEQRASQADKKVSKKVVSLKYVPSCCRKPLRRDLFTLLPLPQQHPQQMLALLPRGSALEKALLSIKAAAPPAFSSKMCTKPKITAPPSPSSTLRPGALQ